MLRKSVKLDVIGSAVVLWQVLGSGNSRSESCQMFSSFAEKKHLVLRWEPKINDMQIYELSNSYPRP